MLSKAPNASYLELVEAVGVVADVSGVVEHGGEPDLQTLVPTADWGRLDVTGFVSTKHQGFAVKLPT